MWILSKLDIVQLRVTQTTCTLSGLDIVQVRVTQTLSKLGNSDNSDIV